MKFLVLLLATAALASASTIGRKNFDIKDDEHGPFNTKDIEIEVTGPNTVAKKIHITNDNEIQVEKNFDNKVHSTYEDIHSFQEDRYKRSSYPVEKEVLEYFFRQYQNVVDEQTFQYFFKRVQEAVMRGQISPYFLNFFQTKYYTQFHHDQYSNKWEVYEQEHKWTPFWYKYFYGNQFNKFEHFYGQDAQEVLKHVFVQFFDEQVFVHALKHYGVFNQVVFDHVFDEEVFDKIFTTEGIFDYHFLIKLINNQYLRKTLVEQGIFNETVLEQLLYILNNQGVEAVYGNAYLEQLVNKHTLKYYFFKQGFFKYVLQHIFYHYNVDTYEYNFMVQLVKNPMYRDFFVHHGIFHTEVLKQLYYVWKTQGFYSQALFEQLVNKQVLKQFLREYGTFDEYTFNHFLEHEVLGLKYLIQSKFFQQTPKYNYKQWAGIVSNVPEMVYENNYDYYPYYNNAFVGFDYKTYKPYHHEFNYHYDTESEYPTKYEHSKNWYNVYGDKLSYYWRNFFQGKPEFTHQYKYEGKPEYYHQYKYEGKPEYYHQYKYEGKPEYFHQYKYEGKPEYYHQYQYQGQPEYTHQYQYQGHYQPTHGKQTGFYNQVPLVEHKMY